MSNTQLPAEVLSAIDEYVEQYAGSVTNWMDVKQEEYIKFHIRQVVTEFSIKLHQTQQQLDKAKELALEWFKVSTENAHMRYLLGKATFSHPKVLADEALFNEIKTFLDGK